MLGLQKKHEDWMTDDDIAIYDTLIALGQSQLGKEVASNEEYLLHISAMITLRQKKGMVIDINDEQVLELKRIHKEHQEAGIIFETPKNDWYYSPDNLINQPYIPVEVQEQMNEDEKKYHPASNSSNYNIEDEEADEIKKDYVKIVPNIPVIDENAVCDSCGA